jgi:hypothetical protein
LSDSEDCGKNFPDDPTIVHREALLRRVPPKHFYLDENLGRWRPSSAAFEDDDDGDPMSVYRQDIIEAEGGPIRRVMHGHEGYALASLTAGQVRSKDQTVHPDPLPDESSHTQVCGAKQKRTCRWFAMQSEWVISPPV